MRPKWTARAFATGRLPGRPRHTAHVRVLGGSPNDSSQPQNIFVAVASCTWISRPMTGSSATGGAPSPPPLAPARVLSDTGRSRVECDRLLERMGGVEQAVVAQGGAGELQADGQAAAQPAGDRDRRYAGQ